MKILATIIFCSLLIACGKNNNSGSQNTIFSQELNSNEVSRSGYSTDNGFINYAYLLITIDTVSPIKDFYLKSVQNPNIDRQVKSWGTIILGRFNRGSLSQMNHLRRDLSELTPNQRINERERISQRAMGQSFIYIENSLELFNAQNGNIEVVFILENDTRVTRLITL